MDNWPCTVPAQWQRARQQGSAPLQGSAVGTALSALPLFPVQAEMCCTHRFLSLQQVRGGSPCLQHRADPLALQQGTGVCTADGFAQDLPLPGQKHTDLGTPTQLPTALLISAPNPANLPPLCKSQKTREPSGVWGKSINSRLKLVRNNLPKTIQQVFGQSQARCSLFLMWRSSNRTSLTLLLPSTSACSRYRTQDAAVL